MSSKMSGAQRRRAEFGIGGTPRTAELARDDARILNPISYGGQGGDRADNLREHAAYTTSARLEAIRAANIVSRDAWNDLLSAQAGRRIQLKAAGWQRIFDGQFGHGGSAG